MACAVMVLVLGSSQGAWAQPISEDARRYFQAGVALLQDPEGERVEEAYRQFKAAYAISPSPKILGNMGFCAMRLERDGEAIDAYARYLREVGDVDPEERAQIAHDLQTLSVGTARISVEVNKPGVQLLDVRVPVQGSRITNVYGPLNARIEIGIRPGHHIMTAKLEGYEDKVWEFEAYAGARERYAFSMKPRATQMPSQPHESKANPVPWLVTGVGAAMLLSGAITGVIAAGKTKDIENQCPQDRCPSNFDLSSARSDASTFVRITDVLLIGGGVVTVGGLVWGLFFNHPRQEPVATARYVRPGVACTGTGCSAFVGGHF